MGLKFKLDENLSCSLKNSLISEGFDVTTVDEESLGGTTDQNLAEVCKKEQRCLVTADRDFAKILDFPPEQYAGLIVLQHTQRSLTTLMALIAQMIVALKAESPVGKLWIIEPGRIRIHSKA